MNDNNRTSLSYSQPREQGKFIVKGDEPLSKKVTGVRLPLSVHEWVHEKSNYTDWVRRVIAEAARREMKIETK